MKNLILVTALVAAAMTAMAQGSLDFKNKATGIDAPVFAADGVTKLGSAYLGQLYAGKTGESLAPVGQAVAFKDGSGLGYVIGGKVLVPGVLEGGKADVILKAWRASDGATFQDAKNSGGLYGESQLVVGITTGGDNLVPPQTPALLTGLTSFSLVPEPSTLALGMLGAAALLLRRRS